MKLLLAMKATLTPFPEPPSLPLIGCQRNPSPGNSLSPICHLRCLSCHRSQMAEEAVAFSIAVAARAVGYALSRVSYKSDGCLPRP